MINQKMRVYKNALIDKLNDTSLTDPKTYWKVLSELDGIYNKNTKHSDNIAPELWVEQFKWLMIKPPLQGTFVDGVNNVF